MRFLIFLIIFLINFASIILAEDNIFNNYLLHKESFQLQYTPNSLSILNQNLIKPSINFQIEKNKRNPLKTDDKIKKYFDITSKLISPNLNLSVNNNTNIKIGYKDENAEFVPVGKNKEIFYRKAYNFDFQQFWGYNIASKFSYIYQKDYFQKINNFNLKEKRYSLNLTKYFKKDKFDILYQYVDIDLDNNNENIYMLEDEKVQKISFSYEISFSNKFSLVLLYSIDETVNKDDTMTNNYLYTGFKYFFNSDHSK